MRWTRACEEGCAGQGMRLDARGSYFGLGADGAGGADVLQGERRGVPEHRGSSTGTQPPGLWNIVTGLVTLCSRARKHVVPSDTEPTPQGK